MSHCLTAYVDVHEWAWLHTETHMHARTHTRTQRCAVCSVSVLSVSKCIVSSGCWRIRYNIMMKHIDVQCKCVECNLSVLCHQAAGE